MFNFFHPRPVVDGRAVAVKVVQQKTTQRHETRTLVVPAPAAPPAPTAAPGNRQEPQGRPAGAGR